MSECSRRGICVDYDVCKCQPESTGNDCTQYSCASLDHCSGEDNDSFGLYKWIMVDVLAILIPLTSVRLILS